MRPRVRRRQQGTSGGTKIDPAFVSTLSPYNYHLKPNDALNLACCVDKVSTAGSVPLPTHDIDSSARPKGAGYDIGGHEVQ